MNFSIAVLFTLALAMGVQSSVLPLGIATQVAGHGLAYTAVSGPAAVPVWGAGPAAVAVHASPWSVGPWGAPWAAAPWGAVAHAPAASIVVAPGIEGTYVAKTRGAVHTAPLSGHAISAAAINVAPAPGTV